MVFIYILKLQAGKYYVGKTTNPSFRLDKHFNGDGSAWTRTYPPIKVMEVIPDCDDYDEDKYTKIWMDKYGLDNVRGGSFVSLTLDDSTINHLIQMSNGTNDKCFDCGKSGHFAVDCKKVIMTVNQRRKVIVIVNQKKKKFKHVIDVAEKGIMQMHVMLQNM